MSKSRIENRDHNEHKNHHHNENMGIFDPVCGRPTGNEKKYLRFDHKGITYYFCGSHCLVMFKNDPERFINKESSKSGESRHEKPLLGRPYTCPVHRKVIQDCPGSCYQCGTTLVLVPPFHKNMLLGTDDRASLAPAIAEMNGLTGETRDE